jgi:hypothetical protein
MLGCGGTTPRITGYTGVHKCLNKVFRPRQFRERLAGPFSGQAIYVNEPPDRACTFGSPDIGPPLANRAGASGLALFLATGPYVRSASWCHSCFVVTTIPNSSTS